MKTAIANANGKSWSEMRVHVNTWEIKRPVWNIDSQTEVKLLKIIYLVHIKPVKSYLKRVFRGAAVPLLRVEIGYLVHAGWQIGGYGTPTDGLYLVHGHVGGQLADSRRQTVKKKNKIPGVFWGGVMLTGSSSSYQRTRSRRKEATVMSHPVKVNAV